MRAGPAAVSPSDPQAGAPKSGASTGDTLTDASRARDLNAFRTVMKLFAVTTVAAGVVIGLAPLGLEPGTARLVSSALLLVGICDSLVLRYWNRLFRNRG